MSGILQFVIYCIETNILIPPIIKFVKTSIYVTRTKKQRQNSLGEKMVRNTKQLSKDMHNVACYHKDSMNDNEAQFR